ncbi:MAG: hypothetical protein QNI90_01355 [Dinoroseobacter sp.]|nr:hypothetical protein [Dinoroseobacter sp.]
MLPRSFLILLMLLNAPVLQAQTFEEHQFEQELDRFSESARRFMQELAGELGPLLLQLEMLMDEITAYQAPEILENGDIIIRRKPDMPDTVPETPEAEGDAPIEL